MASEQPETVESEAEDATEYEYVVEQPQGLTLGEMEISILNEADFCAATGAIAILNRDGALYVLLAPGTKWINVENLPKNKTASVKAIK